MAPIPAVRQKRSNELSTSCQAALRLGTSASDEGVVIWRCLLCGFDTPSLRAQGGQHAPSPIQQWPGQSPGRNDADAEELNGSPNPTARLGVVRGASVVP